MRSERRRGVSESDGPDRFEGTAGMLRERGVGQWSRLGREVVWTLAIGAGFVAVGVAWAAIASELQDRRERSGPIAYAPNAMSTHDAKIWLVDGYNVLHAAVLGGRDRSQWWTEARRRELFERVSGFDADAEVWIVFDGPSEPNVEREPSWPRCVFAASADAWLVDRVKLAADPAAIAVVTADRKVADRARGRGARVVSPRDFLARCAS